MYDPGLPPRPRSLNLLESLVKEEEERARQNSSREIYIPLQGTLSAENYDADKAEVDSEASASANKENKMKETKPNTKNNKTNSNAGLKGKKVLRRQRSRSNSSERFSHGKKKSQRPFSADYNQKKREQINSNMTNGRAKSAKGPRRQQRVQASKGQVPRSRDSYSSDSYSSDEEYPKKKAYGKRARKTKNDKQDHDDFFDSDKDKDKDRRRDSYSTDSSSRSSSASSYSSEEADRRGRRKYSSDDSRSRSRSRSRSSSSSSSSSTQSYDRKVTKSEPSHKISRSSKTVYVDKHGQQQSRKRAGSENSDCQRMVVVDDYSSLSEEEEIKPVTKTVSNSGKPKRLLTRKKKKKMAIVQIDPEMYIEGRLHQKYCELEELMACSFVDQKSQITRHHLYQMELLRDQYKTVSHGRPSSAIIIPRSLPGSIRSKGQRPGSAKAPTYKHRDADTESYDNAYGTMRSVMAAERARKFNKIRTDIHADRPSSAKKSGKKKKQLEARLKTVISDSEEDISEKPSTMSKGSSRSDGSSLTPRAPAIDHHIKYTENEKLKRWLKEKDKLYRKTVKAERKKKRDEREKLINEANDKLEKKIESQKRVKEWMKEKNKEMLIKHKEERRRQKEERKESQKREVVLPGESMQVNRHTRADDVTVEKDKCKGQETPEYVKQQIHDKRDIQEENKQAKLAEKGGPHPPQTKFIYKRPVAGKIKLNMKVRGKSPNRPDSANESSEKEAEENEKNNKIRLSYDEWIKQKRDDDIVKKRNAKKMKQSEMAKSDPELNRMIPDIAKKRIEDKLNSRKRVNTGIKSFDEEANKSFGGADFDGESQTERPRSAYRLEGDMAAKPPKRPSTAPASRGRMPQPKKSATSPRKAIIPQKVDKIMQNNDNSKNPYIVPFPPEKGIPAHVAARQRRIFAERVTDNMSESEQRELLQEILVKEGVANIDETGTGNDEQQEDTATETTDSSKQADIKTLMYSPRKKDPSSDTSESDNEKQDENPESESAKETAKPEEPEAYVNKLEESQTHIDSFGSVENDKVSSEAQQNEQSDVQNSNQYKTYENLNELPLDRDGSYGADNDLGIDIEKLRERVESLRAEPTGPPLIFSNDQRDSYESRSTDEEDTRSESIDGKNIKVISEETDQNLVGILKESKRMDDIPVPEHSDEPPEISHKTQEDGTDSTQLNPEDSLNASRKRVSFNEQTEVFQSLDSSSTDTVTPNDAEFDPEAEGLDNQPYYVDEPEYADKHFNSDTDEDQYNPFQAEAGTLSFNIAGFELNPTVIQQNGEEEKKQESTFITNPDMDSSA